MGKPQRGGWRAAHRGSLMSAGAEEGQQRQNKQSHKESSKTSHFHPKKDVFAKPDKKQFSQFKDFFHFFM